MEVLTREVKKEERCNSKDDEESKKGTNREECTVNTYVLGKEGRGV